MLLWWIGIGLALAAGAGFAVAWMVLGRLVVKLQLAPVAIHNVDLPVDAQVVLDGALDVDVEVPVEAVLTAQRAGARPADGSHRLGRADRRGDRD